MSEQHTPGCTAGDADSECWCEQPHPTDAELEAIAPQRRRLLTCVCGTVAVGYGDARCGRHPTLTIGRMCPARWDTWQAVDDYGEASR